MNRQDVRQARRLHPLNRPRSVRVITDDHGRPTTVHLHRKAWRVDAIREEWRIDDEWWRAVISRRYLTVILENGRPLTLYEDLVDDAWYVQDE